MSLRFTRQSGFLRVCRLAPDEPIPAWATQADGLWSLTRTRDELSIVCADASVPAHILSEGAFVGFSIDGPLDFSLTGILAAVASTLAAVGVSIFVLSTYDTDIILVPEAQAGAAAAALRKAGHELAE